MRRSDVVLMGLLVLLLAGALSAAERGAAKGTVLSTQAWKGERGQIMLSVTLRTDEGVKRSFSVGPEKPETYARVAQLREGQRVTIGWVAEGDRLWIREIVAGDGKDRERRERKGEGDEPRPAGEREGKRRKARDRERVERKRTERDEKEERRRDEMTEKERSERAETRELQEAVERLQNQLNEVKEQLKRRQRERGERD